MSSANHSRPSKQPFISLRTLAFAAAVLCTAMLLPLFTISLSAHPVHDDFVHALPAAQAWAQTGSLWETLKAAWAHTLTMYNTWQGTFAAMFLSALSPMVFSPSLFPLSPLLTLTGLLLSAAYFTQSLLCEILKANKSTAMIFYTLLLALLLTFLPGIREVIYWHSGTPYTVSIILLFFMLGLLSRLQQPQKSTTRTRRTATLFLCGFLLGGCPYPLALGAAVGFFGLALWCFFLRSPVRWGSLCAFLSTTFALILVIAAPGNALRQTRAGDAMAPLSAIIHSIAECIEITGQWFSPQMFAAALILIPLLLPLVQKAPFSFRHPFMVMLLSFATLSAAFVPPIFATGLEGHLVERVLGSLYMLYVLLCLLNFIYLTGYFAKTYPTLCQKWIFFCEEGFPSGLLLLCATLFLWGLFSVGILATPSISAAKNLFMGEAAVYHQELTQREQEIAAAKTPEDIQAAIRPLSVECPVFPRDLLIYPFQRESPFPLNLQKYYRIHQLVLRYGAGEIPPEEWEAFIP